LENPLLYSLGLPDFEAIAPEHVEPALREALTTQRHRLKTIERLEDPTFDWALELERIQDAVRRVWGPVIHLNSVRSTPELRDAYNRCLPMITDFWIEFGQNEHLYTGYEKLKARNDANEHIRAQLIEHALRDFRLTGVALPHDERKRYSDCSQKLAAAQASFEQNLMDATDAFRYHETDERELAGLPTVFLDRARKNAQAHDLGGWLLMLDPPTYSAVLAQAESEALRERYYAAWSTRASDQGPQAGRWDNTPLLEQILALRHESARLLGYDNYAALSLATKMAATPDEVIAFLRDLAQKSRPVARREFEELETYAGRPLNAWDVSFYAERLKRERFQISAEELRPYFPLPRVLKGLFRVVKTLFAVGLSRADAPKVWHPDVGYFQIRSTTGEVIGSILTDLYARPNKRGGAWMDEAQTRARLPGLEQMPIAYLVCNFNPPSEGQPSLLTHDEVVTLFHEFGHALHHLLTEIDYPSIAGIHGVPWDAVELPSQFFENYAWLPETLPWISAHYETDEPLPVEKLATLKSSRGFHAGLSMVRQLEFALFDFRIHAEYDPANGARVARTIAEVRDEVAVVPVPAYNRFANTFSHVFGGGYAAGYYSYKWAEVLAADAFSAFEERGVFSHEPAQRFRECILASGGSRDALEAFTEFRGRKPMLEPLLRQSGILT